MIEGCFNPCFNGSAAEIILRKFSVDISIVSILVLMEVPLKYPAKLRKHVETDCFNPCFNGSAAEIEN